MPYLYSVRRRKPQPAQDGKMSVLRPEKPTAIVTIPDSAKPKAQPKKKSDG